MAGTWLYYGYCCCVFCHGSQRRVCSAITATVLLQRLVNMPTRPTRGEHVTIPEECVLLALDSVLALILYCSAIASGINIYSWLLISAIRITDISNHE